MSMISLLPADKYIVINKTILTEQDRKYLVSFYEPIIGAAFMALDELGPKNDAAHERCKKDARRRGLIRY